MSGAAPSDQPLHFRHWPRGVPHALRVPQVTLSHYLDVAAQRYPDKPAFIYCGRTLSYAELQRQVHALAGWLQQQAGVARGDRVLLMSQNGPAFVVAYYASLRVGAAVVPVNPMTTTAELSYYLSDTGASLAFVAAELLDTVRPLLRNQEQSIQPGLQHVVVHRYTDGLSGASGGCSGGADDSLPEAMRAALPAELPVGVHRYADALDAGLAPRAMEAGPDDLAVLPYTSGTTGHPKGCRHSHRTVLASNLASQVWRGLHADAVFLCVAPLFHMLGMQNGMNVPITLGATVVMMPRWNAAQAVRLVEQHRVSVWAAPPAMVIDFFAQPEAATRDLSSLALLSGGGAAMPEAVATHLAERFGLHYNEAYGLSETASFLHANPVARGKRQCLGVPTQGVDSRIVDPVTLQELPAGEVGELITRGEQLMLGYWRNPEADQAAFVELDGRRYFRTGDLAAVDEDGYFFMRDRLKRMVNASGFKVWPAEVESAMYEHPAIHEACIVGVPDAKRGETVKALVVLKPEHRGRVTEADLIDWCRERMAVYKAPRLVRFMDNLPKSSTGKILWRELQAAEQASTQDTPDAPDTERP